MFKTRLLSGIVLVLLALLFIIHGGYLLLTVLGIISLIGLFELYRVFGIEKSAPGIVGYCILSECSIGFYPGYYDVCDGIADRVYVRVCFWLSEISCEPDHCYIFRRVLCGSYAVLHL